MEPSLWSKRFLPSEGNETGLKALYPLSYRIPDLERNAKIILTQIGQSLQPFLKFPHFHVLLFSVTEAILVSLLKELNATFIVTQTCHNPFTS